MTSRTWTGRSVDVVPLVAEPGAAGDALAAKPGGIEWRGEDGGVAEHAQRAQLGMVVMQMRDEDDVGMLPVTFVGRREPPPKRAVVPAQQRIGQDASAVQVEHDRGMAQPGDVHDPPARDASARRCCELDSFWGSRFRCERHNVPMMRAVVFDTYDEMPTLREVDVPECPPDAALVRVAATGVCRSDWHAWKGGEPVALPHVPGHELAGTVERVGSDVRGWRSGCSGDHPIRQRLRRMRALPGR